MFKIKIITMGKTKEPWLSLALSEYEKRLSSRLEIEWYLIKTEKNFLTVAEKEKNYHCLDIKGELLTSEAFCKKLFDFWEKNKCHLSFFIGGPEGLPSSLKTRATGLWSLSTLTFTHQMARLLFLEQIFRAFEIISFSSYHK